MNYQSPYILIPGQMPDDVTINDIGGKAYHLQKLTRCKLRVPNWFVVSAGAFDVWLSSIEADLHRLLAQVKDPLSARSAAIEISTLLATCAINDTFAKQVNFAVYRQFGVCARLAVRSSATDEDGANHSFAGQFDSFLNVSPDDVLQTIIKVWQSAFSERVLVYRVTKNLPLDRIRVAVIIQEMVHAVSSGVMFTRNPESRRPEVLIDAAFGLGEGVVANQADTDSYRISWTGVLPDRTIRQKRWQVTAAQRAQHGTIRENVPEERSRRAVLDVRQIWRLRTIARTIEEYFGKPQDVEFAFDKSGELYILQSRPITTSHGAGGAGSARIWDNANIVESYPGLTLPLTFSFIVGNYEALFRNACCGMALSKRRQGQRTEIWTNMVGLIHGRVYYNLLNWYAMLSYLPGFKRHKISWDQMIGIKRATDIPASNLPWYDRLYALVQMAYRLLTVRHTERQFFRTFNSLYERYRTLAFSKMNEPELIRQYGRMERELLGFWHVTLYTDFCAMKYYDWLAHLCHRWAGTDCANLHSDLLCGQPGIESVQPIRSVITIAESIRVNALYRSLFSQHDDLVVWRHISQESMYLPLKQQIQTHLDLYGDRCPEELKLETVTPKDHPELLIGTLRTYVNTDITVSSLRTREQQKLSEAERALHSHIRNPLKRLVIGFVLHQARAAVSGRENMRFARTRTYGLVRTIFRRFGDLLSARRVIGQPDDIWYLTIQEIFGLINGTATASDLNPVVSERRTQYQQFAGETLPSRFETSDPPSLCAVQGIQEWSSGHRRLVGTGCSSGVVEGGAIVLAKANGTRINRKNILIAESTDPSWVFLMAQAGGLVVERGSVLSHTAIIGRELGIPTIVGVLGATHLIPSGCRIRMNGATGEVVWK